MDQTELQLGYSQMAEDHEHEALALEWCEAVIGDVLLDEPEEHGQTGQTG
jgi:hypothetical protein